MIVFALLNCDEDLEYGARYRWYLWVDTWCIFLRWEGFLSWFGVYFVVKKECHGLQFNGIKVGTMRLRRKVAKLVTDAVCEGCGCPAEAVSVVFVDVDKRDWCHAGVPVADSHPPAAAGAVRPERPEDARRPQGGAGGGLPARPRPRLGPARNVKSFHAVFLLYFGGTDPLPSSRELAHLDWMGRGLSASLHARRSLTQAREGWSAARGAVAGEAARRVLAEIEPLLSQGGTVHGQGLPGNELLTLADAAGRVHAVRLLQRGRIEPRNELLDPVLDRLRRAGVEIGGDPGLVVPCEPALLGLALEALVEILVEGGAGPARVAARRSTDGFAVSVHGSRAAPPPPRSDLRWMLAGRVAELHSGQLGIATGAEALAFTLRLPSA